MHSKGIQTRQMIIDKAMILFTKNGYNRTSLSKILSETGLAKGGFYFHFRSKEELGLAVIQSLEKCWTDEIIPQIKKGANAREKLEALFSAPGDCTCSSQTMRPIILLMNLAIEMLETNGTFSSQLQKIFEGWLSMLKAIVEEGKYEALFEKQIDSSSVAAIILSNILGANLLALLNGNSGLYQEHLTALKTILFKGISKDQPTN